jgi:WD40 repeat protein
VRIDLKTSKQIETRQLQHGSVRAAAFSGDGRRLAISTGNKIGVWDTATGQSLRTLDADHETQWSVAFLRDGRQLISGGRGQATLWNLEDGQATTRFDLGSVSYIKTIAISPDETLLAAIPAAAGQTLSVFRIPD